MDESTGVQAAPSNAAEIIDECKERLRLGEEAERENRQEGEYDLKFADGDQWEERIEQERSADQRPCLTINITDAVVRRVINACRENRPRLVVHPVSDADVTDAKVREGLIRHIQYSSNSDYATDTAVEGAIRAGWGYFGIDWDYTAPDSFDRELKFVSFPNQFSCYRDPASIMPDGSDMNWFIETTWKHKNDYQAQFGALDPDGFPWVNRVDNISNWLTKEQIRVAKYWRVQHVRDELLRMSDGDVILRSDLPRKSIVRGMQLSIVERRPTVRKQIQCFLLTAKKVLQAEDVPGRWIPRFPVYGRALNLNGATRLKGLVRDLRDPARMYNYAQTAKTETYALQPKAPWMGAEGFMEGHEAAWRDANRKPIVALEYKPIRNEDGSYNPPPQRQEPPQPNAGFAEWGESTRSDFLMVAGMPNDPGQDARGEVVSGVALRKRQGLADISHFDFYDNLTRTMRHAGRVLLDRMPSTYTGQQVVRIVKEDGTADTVTLNEQQQGDGPIAKVLNDMTKGDFDCVVDTGPAYQTKREESSEALIELLGTPLGETVAKTSGDLVVRAMDFPNADSVADRIEAVTPAAQMSDKFKDLPPKAQAIIAGLQAQLKDSNQQRMGLELELASKRGIEEMKQRGQTERVQIQEAHEDRRAQLDAATKREDTHTRAVTAHDVAEIKGATQLLNTHAEAAHEKEAAKELLKHADSAQKRDV